jgi:hypothetical protein
MKVTRLIRTGTLLLFLGAIAPAYAQQEQHEQEAKPQKQEQQAKPEERQQQAKPAQQQHTQQAPQAKPTQQQNTRQQEAKGQQQQKQQQQQAKTANQNEQPQAKGQQERQQQQAKGQQQQAKTQQNQEKSQHQQQAAGQQNQQAQGRWAHNGQKDSRGHEYTESTFGREHHTRFEERGGRYYNGRREYSYGGYWFYAGAYPAWFYQQDVYFIMGADGLWYAVAYGNPSLMLQVNIA